MGNLITVLPRRVPVPGRCCTAGRCCYVLELVGPLKGEAAIYEFHADDLRVEWSIHGSSGVVTFHARNDFTSFGRLFRLDQGIRTDLKIASISSRVSTGSPRVEVDVEFAVPEWL